MIDHDWLVLMVGMVIGAMCWMVGYHLVDFLGGKR